MNPPKRSCAALALALALGSQAAIAQVKIGASGTMTAAMPTGRCDTDRMMLTFGIENPQMPISR